MKCVSGRSRSGGAASGLILGLAAAALLGICAVSSAKTVTIVNYFRGWGSLTDIYKEVQDEFVKTHPEIKVRFSNAPKPEEYSSRLELMLASGASPDLILMDSTWWARYAKNNLMTDLTDFMKTDKSLTAKDYHKAALDLWTYKGRMYGLPCDVAVMQMAYNKDMFDRQGVPYPKADWNGPEFIDTLKRMTVDRNGDGKPEQFGVSNGWNTAIWEQAVYSMNGNIADRREHPTKCTLNEPEAIEGLQFMADLRNKYRVVGGDFLNSSVALEIVGHWNIPDFNKLVKFKWDVAEIPTLKRKAVIGFGSAYMIPAGSKHKKEAWELLKFYAGPVGSRLLAKANFMTPAYKAVSESDVFLKNNPPNNKRAFLNAFGYIVPRVLTTQWDRLNNAFLPEYYKVLNGTKSPKEAMASVAPVVTRLFERDK